MTDIIIVTGLPRSGTSLMMQMLHMGGLPIYAENTWAYETPLNTRLPEESAWLQDCRGKAVKIIDPHRFTPPKGLPCRFIWMTRNIREQAKSQVKFLRTLGHEIPKCEIKTLIRYIDRDMTICVQLLKTYQRPLLHVRFESLIKHPMLTAKRVSVFCDGLNVEAMARCVKKRSPKALPYMAELQ